jgi:hypothetical protein
VQVTVLREFWTPKRGNRQEEYEDAYAYRIPERRFAVADGATEAAFSDRWAQSLVRRFTAAPPAPFAAAAEPLEAWLKPLQQHWHRGIDWDGLPWFAQDKTRAGAFATMLGIEFDEHAARASSDTATGDGAHWFALAIGDSCLFQVRADELLAKFPMEQARAFNTSPMLVSSNPASNRRVWENIRHAEGDGQPGDLFFMATDALSQWFLAQCEAGEKPWQQLCALRDNDEFVAFCEALRDTRAMRNDDVTLLILQAHPDTYVPAELSATSGASPLTPIPAVSAAQTAQISPGAATTEQLSATAADESAPPAAGPAPIAAASSPGQTPAENEQRAAPDSAQFDPEATLIAPRTRRTEPASAATDVGAVSPEAAAAPAASVGFDEQEETLDREQMGEREL